MIDRKVSLSGEQSLASLGQWHICRSLSYSFPFYILKKKHPQVKDVCELCLLNLINTCMKEVVIYFRNWKQTNKKNIPVLSGVTTGLCSASLILALFILAALEGWRRAGGRIRNIISSYKIKPVTLGIMTALSNSTGLGKHLIIEAGSHPVTVTQALTLKTSLCPWAWGLQKHSCEPKTKHSCCRRTGGLPFYFKWFYFCRNAC